MPGSTLCDFKETAKGGGAGKVSAFQNADTIKKLAEDALAILATLEPGEDPELRLTLQDVEALARLGLYCAHKFRAAIYLEQKKRDEARDCMAEAYGHWKKYTTLMSSLYRGVELQRNRALPDWHAYDSEALKDFTDLGGGGTPEPPK